MPQITIIPDRTDAVLLVAFEQDDGSIVVQRYPLIGWRVEVDPNDDGSLDNNFVTPITVEDTDASNSRGWAIEVDRDRYGYGVIEPGISTFESEQEWISRMLSTR